MLGNVTSFMDKSHILLKFIVQYHIFKKILGFHDWVPKKYHKYHIFMLNTRFSRLSPIFSWLNPWFQWWSPMVSPEEKPLLRLAVRIQGGGHGLGGLRVASCAEKTGGNNGTYGISPWKNTQIYIYIYIWVNYNISLTWIKAILGWFPLLTMIPVRSQWGRYNLPRYICTVYSEIIYGYGMYFVIKHG